MHIYNVKTKGSYIGVRKADLKFKVAGLEEDNLKVVKDQLKDKFNMKIEPAKIINENKG
jgi:hypothetical protein